MIAQNEISAEAMREIVQEVAQAQLPLEANGYQTSTEMLYDVLLKAASEGMSLAAATRDLAQSASGNTIRELINQQLEPTRLREHEAEVNAALAARIPAHLHNHPVEVSIDEHDEPCYGKSDDLREYTCRTRAKAGTTHVLRIASAYVRYRQLRLTLAVTFVLPEDKPLDIVQRLHQRLLTLELQLQGLYMDRGFCCGTVIQYLQGAKQAAILACPIRGKQGGTRQLCRGRKSYRTTYTFTDGTTAQLAVVAALVPGKDKKRHRKWLLFVVIGLKWQPHTVYRRYRHRFGIESTYRLLRQVRIKTSSRNVAFRFFVLAFALLLVNLWAVLRWVVARMPGPGPHRVDPLYFPLLTFVALLRRAVDLLYEAPMTIPLRTSLLKS